jgi:hypothetical protein
MQSHLIARRMRAFPLFLNGKKSELHSGKGMGQTTYMLPFALKGGNVYLHLLIYA